MTLGIAIMTEAPSKTPWVVDPSGPIFPFSIAWRAPGLYSPK